MVPPKITHKLSTVKPRKVEMENATPVANASQSKAGLDNEDSSSATACAPSLLSPTASTSSATLDEPQKKKHEFVSRTVGLMKFKRK